MITLNIFILLVVWGYSQIPASIGELNMQGNNGKLSLNVVDTNDAIAAGNGVVKIALPNGLVGAADLVSPTDPEATEVRIQTSQGTMSWREKGLNLYFTTLDNENNDLQGVPDNDMDTWIYNTNSRAPIEFNIFINDNSVTSAELNIYAYDIDAPGEVDEVYINGNYIGNLIGSNGQWTTTTFNVDPAYVSTGTNASNLIQVLIDVNYTGEWALEVDWGELVINGKDNPEYKKIKEKPGKKMTVND